MEILRDDILKCFPAIDEKKVDRLLEGELQDNNTKIIVLDDDPTGVQTVHDVSVYTEWDIDSIKSGFEEPGRIFYILTNSRGMTEIETTKIHKIIGENIAYVSEEMGRPYFLISRSDSTLRGHFPLETEILKNILEEHGQHVNGEIICPFFKEGGRFTINNIHYVKQGDFLIPAAQTEFAKDKTFGFLHSSIPEYIEEKTKGNYKAKDVICISLKSLREMKFDRIEQQLLEADNFCKICVNAIDYYDIKVFAIALYRAIRNGKRFIFRTASSFVKIVGGISSIPLLKRNDIISEEHREGGVIVVGSHTEKTTSQLKKLLELDNVVPIGFDSDKVLEERAFEKEIECCVRKAEELINAGKTAVCYTQRKLLTLPGDTPETALQRSIKISDGVQSLVSKLNVAPSFVVAKGGITSYDVGVKALKVRKAEVAGQILPGIPVWRTGDESKFPYIPYVIFPGNTGDENSLRDVVKILTDGTSSKSI